LFLCKKEKELPIKDVRSQELVQCGHFADRGRGFWCGRPHLLVQKLKIFLKFMMCPHKQRGESTDILRPRGSESVFCGFVRTSFMEGSLSWNMQRKILVAVH